MKIGMITLHSIYNPGSSFQAYGLQRFLAENGHEIEIIDYRPDYSTVGKDKLKGIVRKILFHRNEKKVKEKFESFINERMLLSAKRYGSYQELEKNPPVSDLYISGSDQLWNMYYDCGRDDAYYLTFAKGGKKISYATSLGKKTVPAEELQHIAERIQDFSMLSVREKSSSELLEKKLNRPVHWVCDPVFLLPVEVYQSMTSHPDQGRYAVVYLSEESDLLNQVVADIKAKLNCKIILMGGNRTRCACDEHIKDLGPYDFLSMIEHAEIVISSSFHATAFSHIFHKKFGVILPENNGERIRSLLGLSGLNNHILELATDIPAIYEEIDYDEVDERLTPFIKQSKETLLNAIG